MSQNTSPLVLYLHIPKTAGTTLSSIIEAQYNKNERAHEHQHYILSEIRQQAVPPKLLSEKGSEFFGSLKLVKGHFLFGYHEYLTHKECFYFTFLRDPVSRVISDYYHIIETPQHYLHNKVISRKLSLEEYVKSDIWFSDNLQVRFLSGNHHFMKFNEVTQEALEIAKVNLNRCPVFGLTEKFDESVLLLKEVFDWELLKCSYVKKRVIGSNRLSKANLSSETKKLIEELNCYDIELYEYAKERFEESKKRILCERRSNIKIFEKQLFILQSMNKYKQVSSALTNPVKSFASKIKRKIKN